MGDQLSLRAIELFCCAGGMGEGFRRAGITFRESFDPDACDSYEKNLGHRPVQMDVRDLVRLTVGGWRPKPLDLLVADPPCTPWSRAGKREGLADERDMLADTCRLIALLQPRAWLIGNVPGLDDATNASAVDQTIGNLAIEHGYHVDYAKLDAADYGVPQHRVRPFWFGHRFGSHCLRWPEPSHGPRKQLCLPTMELLPWVTCRAALEHLPVGDLGRPVRVRWKKDTDHKLSHPDEPGITQTRNANGDGALLALSDQLPTAKRKRPGKVSTLTVGRAKNRDPNSHSDQPAKTIRTKSGDQTSAVLLAHERHPLSHPDAPARAITTKGEERGASGGQVLHWPWEPSADPKQPNAIVLSEKARAILQGFPEDWHFAGKTKASRSSQLGMAMPPPLAHAVAASIATWFCALAQQEAAE